MNESFSATTRRLAADADKTVERVITQHPHDWHSIPAQYRQTIRHFIRMGYYEGRGDGAQALVDGLKPKGGA